MPQYARLDAERIVETTRRLRERIEERFPGAGLGRLAARLLEVTGRAAAQAEHLRRRNLPLRAAVGILLLALPASLGWAVYQLGWKLRIGSVEEFVPFLQASLETLVFLGAGLAFLVTLEARLKRGRTLRAVHELRVLAHLVDMHQLDKDPVFLSPVAKTTAHSPKRTMTAFELNRYLDYCCELLSIVGKIAVLYGQSLDDPVAVEAVDQVESLTTGLSRKIWQKTILIPRAAGNA
jgi:hypothetical protein